MADLIFEIGCEELPAKAIDIAIASAKEFFARELSLAHLGYATIRAHATPRRIAVIIGGLAPAEPDREEEVLGPKLDVAFTSPGQLSAAGLGFLKSRGLKETDVFVKEQKKGAIIAAKVQIKGRTAKEIIEPLLLKFLHEIPFEKRMRWEASGQAFARPIRWMVALLGALPLHVAYADVVASTYSRGHRFLAPEPFLVTDVQSYLSELDKRFVVLDEARREALIADGIAKKAQSIGALFKRDDELMTMVRNLVEYPWVLVGDFEEKYLSMPEQLLISEMKAHQKCFALYKPDGSLCAHFACVANVPGDEAFFARGYARVLRARFEDGAFYFASDQQKTLREHAEQLKGLIFEKELGTFFLKSERIKHNALLIANYFNVTDGEVSNLTVAASLVKADLVSGVVGEFPELQGIMGKFYARAENYDAKICEAIEQHYWPRFSFDELPTSKVAAILSVADKMDTLVGIFGIGKKPKGNKDPYALRRAAIGVVRIILGFSVSMGLRELIDIALKGYVGKFDAQQNGLIDEVEEFIRMRARGLLIEQFEAEGFQGVVNCIDGVMAVGSKDLVDVYARCHTLLAMQKKNRDDFDSLSQTFKRASNIVIKEGTSVVALDASHESLLTTPYEQELMSSVAAANGLLDGFQANQNKLDLCRSYEALFNQIASVKPKLDAFFDNVMVMVDDEKVKGARLALLGNIKKIADNLADFRHL